MPDKRRKGYDTLYSNVGFGSTHVEAAGSSKFKASKPGYLARTRGLCTSMLNAVQDASPCELMLKWMNEAQRHAQSSDGAQVVEFCICNGRSKQEQFDLHVEVRSVPKAAHGRALIALNATHTNGGAHQTPEC